MARTSAPGGTHFPVIPLGAFEVCLMTLDKVEDSGGAGLLTASPNVS